MGVPIGTEVERGSITLPVELQRLLGLRVRVRVRVRARVRVRVESSVRAGVGVRSAVPGARGWRRARGYCRRSFETG